MKEFKAGDKIRCINFDIGEGTRCWAEEHGCKIGNIYTVKRPLSFHWVNIVEDPKGVNCILETSNFELVESAEEEQPITNANVKMITTFVPTWAKWMAMSSFGVWHVYADKPRRAEGTWDSCSSGSFVAVGRCDPKDIIADWKETLHEV